MGLEVLHPLLDTNDQRVIADTDPSNFKRNLLHAAAGINDVKQRAAAVGAVAGKAAQQGWHAVFTAKNSKQQTAVVIAKVGDLKRLLTEAETRARHVADANKQKAAKAAAAASQQQEQQQQQSEQNNADAAKAAEAAAATAAHEKRSGKSKDGAAADSHEQQQESAAAAVEEIVIETEQQRRERWDRLLALIPTAVQAALAPSKPAAAPRSDHDHGDHQQHHRIRSQRAAEDVELIRGRITQLAPDQIPEKDIAMGQGLLPTAADSKHKRQREMSEITADATLDDLDHDDPEDDDDFDPEPARDEDHRRTADEQVSAAAAVADDDEEDIVAAAADFDENSLNGLPWEFTMTREARLEWTNLEP